jgi:hypothetical protein
MAYRVLSHLYHNPYHNPSWTIGSQIKVCALIFRDMDMLRHTQYTHSSAQSRKVPTKCYSYGQVVALRSESTHFSRLMTYLWIVDCVYTYYRIGIFLIWFNDLKKGTVTITNIELVPFCSGSMMEMTICMLVVSSHDQRVWTTLTVAVSIRKQT